MTKHHRRAVKQYRRHLRRRLAKRPISHYALRVESARIAFYASLQEYLFGNGGSFADELNKPERLDCFTFDTNRNM